MTATLFSNQFGFQSFEIRTDGPVRLLVVSEICRFHLTAPALIPHSSFTYFICFYFLICREAVQEKADAQLHGADAHHQNDQGQTYVSAAYDCRSKHCKKAAAQSSPVFDSWACTPFQTVSLLPHGAR